MEDGDVMCSAVAAETVQEQYSSPAWRPVNQQLLAVISCLDRVMKMANLSDKTEREATI
jgi:hypothetical protein